jgi:hypothetical protein
MLVARSGARDAPPSVISRWNVLRVVGRRALPTVMEATIIPSILFYAFLVRYGAPPAMLAALGWSYGSVGRRLVTGRAVPGLLQLGLAGLTVRTVVGLVSGTFMYFLQPIATTLVLATLFLVTLRFGRPMIARLASDFCPLHPDIAARPAVVRLFSRLTLLWAGVQLLSAVSTFMMLTTLPTTVFVPLKTVVSLTITVGAVVWTVTRAMRTAHAENLMFAPAYS